MQNYLIIEFWNQAIFKISYSLFVICFDHILLWNDTVCVLILPDIVAILWHTQWCKEHSLLLLNTLWFTQCRKEILLTIKFVVTPIDSRMMTTTTMEGGARVPHHHRGGADARHQPGQGGPRGHSRQYQCRPHQPGSAADTTWRRPSPAL